MNDYELIYLIHCEHDEHALNFMFAKYHKFIWKQVYLFNIESKEREDFHQEGILMLHKAIQTFKAKHNKSFMRYFELILRRHYYQLIKSLPKYYLFEHTDFCKTICYIEEEPVDLDLKSPLEQHVYQAYFLNRLPIEQIVLESIYTKKQIYNSIYRIKEKYKIVI